MQSAIFLGCNYNDKSIKATFDNLKNRIERDYPISCTIIDKRAGKTANDLWVDIQDNIDRASLAIFDVSGFRPNVVLELGYALATKNENEIMITFRKRKNKGKAPDWLLSDIGHLRRAEYRLVSDLERDIRAEIERMIYIKRYKDLENICITAGDQKYFDYISIVLFTIRNEGKKTQNQIAQIIKGTNLRITKVMDLMKKKRLIIIDSNNRIQLT